MDFINTLAQGISVELFATLAGASIVAVGIIADIMSKAHERDTTWGELITDYLGMAYFITSFTIFILGVIITLVLDSIGVYFINSHIFEIINVIIRAFTLASGIMLLFGGVDALARKLMKRDFRFFPRTDKYMTLLLGAILPKEKPKTKTESAPPTKLKDIDLKNARKLLSDQLKTSFIAILLVLWLRTLNVTVHRGPWFPWLIASVLLFIWIILDYQKKKLLWPKLRWVLPFAAVIILWAFYFLSGVSFSPNFITIFAVILLFWTLFLVIALLLSMTKITPGGKLETRIKRLAIWGDAASWPLTIGVLLISILLGWVRLWNAGVKDWWMTPLLYWGVFILIVVVVISIQRNENI